MSQIRFIISKSIAISKFALFRSSDILHITSLRVQLGRNMSKQWSGPQELRIPVSYGFTAAKAWGDENDEPVLALHGWQDNAGTFDPLIPLLSPEFYIVAVDSPGHGFSSHKPIGAFYHYIETVVDVKRVVDFMQWDRFSIIGHSMGGTIALLYSSIFPEAIKNVIVFDIVKPSSCETNLMPMATRKGVFSLLEIEKKMSQPTPVYRPEDARERLISGLFNQVTPESADVLLKRGSRPSDCGQGVVFTRDLRLKTASLRKFSHDELKVYLSNVKCNVLIISSTSPGFFMTDTPEVIPDFLDIYKKNCKSFQIVTVEGTHFVHLNNPDRVAPFVNNFLKADLNKLSKT